MLRIGKQEAEAVEDVLTSGRMFRYQEGGQCARFEQRYGEYLGVKHVAMCTSGTTAVPAAALAGLGIGPGDEVLVPAQTYIASALAVLAVGAIPVIVDVNESVTICPQAIDDAVGPCTKAVMPVHMWGTVCNMPALLDVARRRGLKVVEDACQCVGGAMNGRKVGTFGEAGAFSFNYYKNMTAGEGGAVVTGDDRVAERAKCMIDPCRFYWDGREESFRPFASARARASEVAGAILNVQLDRLDDLLTTMRAHKKHVLAATADLPLTPSPCHSPDGECANHVLYLLDSAEAAEAFAKAAGGVQTSNTGRHVFTEWDPIIEHRGSHHPALDPFNLPANAPCRKDYRRDLCPRSLDILARTVMVAMDPNRTDAELEALIAKIRSAVGS